MENLHLDLAHDKPHMPLRQGTVVSLAPLLTSQPCVQCIPRCAAVGLIAEDCPMVAPVCDWVVWNCTGAVCDCTHMH